MNNPVPRKWGVALLIALFLIAVALFWAASCEREEDSVVGTSDPVQEEETTVSLEEDTELPDTGGIELKWAI